MKYIKDFRQRHHAEKLAHAIASEVNPKVTYRFMEYCGGHTHTIYHYGLLDLLPENIHMVHGPGCPVCVLPASRMDLAIFLSKLPDVIFCSYGDVLRIPGSDSLSLLKAKAGGTDVRMVYSVDDTLTIAENNPNKTIIFFAIGFETTAPTTAVAVQLAKRRGLTNFFIYCNHLLTPRALEHLLQNGDITHLDGFIGPGHVSAVIGSHSFESVNKIYQKPVVVTGFEPSDLLQSILMLVRQVNAGRSETENQYTRVVTPIGNVKSQQRMETVFEVVSTFEWRGLGFIPKSALQLRPDYQLFDIERKLELPVFENSKYSDACECGDVLRGLKKPNDCRCFGSACTPAHPVGACMVSAEGACAACYRYKCDEVK